MYIKEKYDEELIEIDHGFITYEISGENMIIKDLWVDPAHRRAHLAALLADMAVGAGKEKGCRVLLTSVSKNANNYEQSLAANTWYGLKKTNEDDSKIYLMKEI
jgi:ribosomal protein S18 acetylase RimI-like enzyme